MSDQQGPSTGTAPPRPPQGTWVLGRIRGIDFTMQLTWLPVAVLLAAGFSSLIGRQFPFLGSWRYVAAFAFVTAFTVSILMHELAHALVAQRFEIQVPRSTWASSQPVPHRGRAEDALRGVRDLDRRATGLAGRRRALAGGRPAARSRGPRGGPLRARGGEPDRRRRPTCCPGCRWTAAGCCARRSGRLTGNPHTGTVAAPGRVAASHCRVLAAPLLSKSVRTAPRRSSTSSSRSRQLFLWAGSTRALVQARVRRRLPSVQVRTWPGRAIAVHACTPVSEAVRMAPSSRPAPLS